MEFIGGHDFFKTAYKKYKSRFLFKLLNPLTHKTPFGDATVALITGKVKVFVTSLFFSP